MALRFGDKDQTNFRWLDIGQSWTNRQLAAVTGVPESTMRRRLGQYVRAGVATASPPVSGIRGNPEREYYVTLNNQKKLRKLAPWVQVSATKPRKPAAVQHHRLINEFLVSLHVAFQAQSHYSYQFLSSYHYDTADPEAPTCIQAPHPRRTTPSDAAVVCDFVLTVKCSSGSSLTYGEIDLGTESLRSYVKNRATIMTKLEVYSAFHDSNGYRHLARRLGERFTGFRVLLATQSPRRLANIRKLCSKLGSTNFIWLTTFDLITPETVLGPIWQTGEDTALRSLLRNYHGE